MIFSFKKYSFGVMNNPGFTDGELMYDFDLFLPQSRKSPSRTDKRVNSVQKQKKRKLSSKFVNAMVMAIILLLIILNLYEAAAISEVALKIEKSKKDMVRLNAEAVRLEAQLLGQTSYATIEQKATEMGMGKPRRDQITYVNIHEKS